VIPDAEMVAFCLDIGVDHLIVEKLRGLRFAGNTPIVTVQKATEKRELPLLIQNLDLHEVCKLASEGFHFLIALVVQTGGLRRAHTENLARWLIFPKTFWNYSPVRNEDNMRVTASNLKRHGNPHELSTHSDAELLRLAVAGEEEAFLLLYGKLKAGIFRYAFYMTGSKVNAEEVTQEVFITLLRESHNYRQDRGDLAAFGIARNFVRRIEHRERPYEALQEDTALATLSGKLISESDALPAQMIRTELAGCVQAAVASLPDHYRQVVVLCDLCEFSYADAASRLHCAIGTIRSRLNRAHALLAEKLRPLRSPQPQIGAAGPEGCLI
jgi:RNA polymerase sigma-70 factor (ECF subfamily)